MHPTDQITAFHNDLWILINRYNEEFDLAPETMIGTMHRVIHGLHMIEDEIEQMTGGEDELN